MNTGDLVNYEARGIFSYTSERYASPGIILSICKNESHKSLDVAEVYWSDGNVTHEHMCYLEPVKRSMNV